MSVSPARLANAIRFLAADAVEAAGSGHPGMPLGMADLATVLFTRHLKFDAADPAWPDRDRFVLSNGHGSMLLYALLHLTGHADVPIEELKRFRKAHARAAGHPEHGHFAAIETTTGPLGQGLATAVGMALAERLLNRRFGDALVNHRTFVFCGDGCLMEGVSQEAISLAGHLGLSRLTLIFDDNHTTIDGPTSLSNGDDQRKRFEASGWLTLAIDGHDPEAIDAALTTARLSDRPTLIAARTHIGFGAPTRQGTAAAHGSPLGPAEIAAMRQRLDWPFPPFEVPADVAAAWRTAGARGAAERMAWSHRRVDAEPALVAELDRRIARRLPEGLEAAVLKAVNELAAAPQDIPVRQGSQAAVAVLARHLPELVGGSADLTASVLSKADGMASLDRADFSGRHIGYGVREHGMAAALNGMALHGGVIPYGGTYLTFSDYCRPAMRLAALMRLKAIFLFSHDSIGVGEDGPTYQPIEHLASLRAIPGLKVYRPADRVEALECWFDAIAGEGPSAMVVARQKVPQVRTAPREDMLARRGAYVLAEAASGRHLTLLATGSEVSLALAVRDALAGDGIMAAVVSMPCWQCFSEQAPEYQSSVLGAAPRFAIEAASPFGWTRYVADEQHVFGVDRFGYSGPGSDLYEAYGLTAEPIATRIRQALAAASG